VGEREEAVPMIHACGERGCDLLTMGEFCVEHEHALTRNDVSLLEALTFPVKFGADQGGLPARATAAEAEHQRRHSGPLIPT
jgi:hypothetical protein